MSGPGTVTDLRRHNRARVLRFVVRQRHATRAELASELGLSPGTVTNVVTELTEEGLLRAGDSLPSSGGRPSARLEIVRDAAFFIGVDVGEHGVDAGWFDLALQSVDSVFIPSGFRNTSAVDVRRVIEKALTELIHRHKHRRQRLEGVGLGLPGIVDTDAAGNISIHAQSLGWPRMELADVIPRLAVPVLADNGAKTLAAAELWAGAAEGVQDCLVVLIGRGLGVGIVTAGHLMRGASSGAGEWGHTKVVANGRRCNCGGYGCLEAYFGGGAVRERAAEVGLAVGASDQETLAHIVRSALDGSKPHQDFLAETLEYLAVGLANLVNLFNPQRIVIGGWAGHRLVSSQHAPLMTAMRRHALGQPAEHVTLMESRGSMDPIALGAALLPLAHFIDRSSSRN